MAQKRILKVAIIGAGMSGLCMAAKPQDAGIDTFNDLRYRPMRSAERGATTPTPGLFVRRPVALLYLFIPAEPRLVTPSCRRGRRSIHTSGRSRQNAASVRTFGSEPTSRPPVTVDG